MLVLVGSVYFNVGESANADKKSGRKIEHLSHNSELGNLSFKSIL